MDNTQMLKIVSVLKKKLNMFEVLNYYNQKSL